MIPCCAACRLRLERVRFGWFCRTVGCLNRDQQIARPLWMDP